MTSRVTNRVGEYQDRRAVALDFAEATHDECIAARLSRVHGDCATGYKCVLVRRALSQFARREADRNAALTNGGTAQ